MQGIFNFLVRLVLLAAGLLFAASLVLAVLVLLALWGLRMLWARLTGRPVTPFVMRLDPRAGFGRFYGRQPFRGGGAAPPEASRPAGPRSVADVTDVEPKPPRD
ncbi:MAG: hypothetical protein KF686_10605 [Ramlibacter sp.]|nr:hypothetical protein [Ramlibacter sp.]